MIKMIGENDFVMPSDTESVIIELRDSLWLYIGRDDFYVSAEFMSSPSDDFISYGGECVRVNEERGKKERCDEIDEYHGEPLVHLYEDVYRMPSSRRGFWLEVCGTGIVLHAYITPDDLAAVVEALPVDSLMDDSDVLMEYKVTLEQVTLLAAYIDMLGVCEELTEAIDALHDEASGVVVGGAPSYRSASDARHIVSTLMSAMRLVGSLGAE